MTPAIQAPVHVLFADDDSDEAYLFNEAIEHLGLSVQISKAKDGNNLIEMLSINDQLPDLLFLDLNMPYKDGIETLKELRADHRYDNLPIVIFSTSGNQAHAETCYTFGANLYIVKPETFDQIVQMVKKIFSTNWKLVNPQPERSSFVVTSFD